MFLSKEFSDPSDMDNYMFHVINMMNPSFEPKALPRLDEIVKIVDLPNIARLKSTKESLDIALQIVDIVLDCASKAKQDNNNNGGGCDGNPDDEVSINDAQPGDGGSGDGGVDVNEGAPTQPSLTAKELKAINDALTKQRNFMSGNLDKKVATKKLQRELEATAKQDITMQSVGNTDVGIRTGLLYDFTKNNTISVISALKDEHSRLDKLKDAEKSWSDKNKFSTQQSELKSQLSGLGVDDIFSFHSRTSYEEAVRTGLEMGALLGKKLQLHNESRERVDSRLRSGKIDAKRLAHAGYDMENVFKQIHVDKYKKANIHISLDGSGSMSGSKWESTIQMACAIAKAASYTQNINVQVSIRITMRVSKGDTPVVLCVYDSRRNKLSQLVTVFSIFSPSSMTPEGLCFETLYKQNMFIENTSELDSYFLNISDGEPGCTNYHGIAAVDHTRQIVEKMRSTLGMQILSFFITHVSGSETITYADLFEKFMSTDSGVVFRRMYGKDASVVDPNSAMQIAKEMNKKFLTKAQTKIVE
jgi:hypothetical protein